MNLLLTNSYEDVGKKMEIHHGIALSKTQIKRILREEKEAIEYFFSNLSRKNKSIKDKLFYQLDGFSVRFLIHNKKIPKKAKGRFRTELKEIKHSLIRAQGSVTPEYFVKFYLDKKYTKEDYKKELDSFFKRNGLGKKTKVFVTADGAPWIKKLMDYFFMNKNNPYYFIIDWYHLSEYIHDGVRAIPGLSANEFKNYLERWKEYAYSGSIEKITQ